MKAYTIIRTKKGRDASREADRARGRQRKQRREARELKRSGGVNYAR